MIKKIFKGIWKCFKSFFCSGDKFQPVYFWITILMAQIVRINHLKIKGDISITDSYALGMAGFVTLWVALYNFRGKK